MPTNRDIIPVHRLEEETDEGFRVERVHALTQDDKDALVMGLHRDDHYMFILVEKGKSMMESDFEVYSVEANMIMCVLPGQIHGFQVIESDEVLAWVVALDPGMVPEEFRTVLEDPRLSKQPLSFEAGGMTELHRCIELIYSLQQRPATDYSRRAIYSLLASFTALFTEVYLGRQELRAGTVTRAQQITRDFRRLLAKEYKTLKSPGEYAAALHLSLSYLNEAVREATGFHVGYWIQREIALEAKRLLYYGQRNVKEIAHELGYEDHTYFSRWFKKTVGKTPGAFRSMYHR